MTYSTVKEITDRVSLLRSRIAICEGLVMHLETNYIGSDSVQPDGSFVRGDTATVPQEHIEDEIHRFNTTIAEALVEIDTLEAMSIAERPTPIILQRETAAQLIKKGRHGKPESVRRT